MLTIDPNDPTPLHAQVERGIRLAVATGRLKKGDQLPTVRQLAVELRINANTVSRVYVALEREGMLETKRGVGTFLSAVPPPRQHAAQRERQLDALSDKYITDATSLGFSPAQVLDHLAHRLKKGV